MFRYVVFLFFSGVIGFAIADGDNEAYQFAQKVDSRDDGFKSSSADVNMLIANASGEATQRKLKVDVLEVEDNGNKTLMEFTFPADIKGTALLSHPNFGADDDQWLYLPGIKRVKRISSRNKSGAFVGSEFSFEDLTDKYIDDYSYEIIEEKECAVEVYNGSEYVNKTVSCKALQRKGKDKYSAYSREVLYIDEKHYRILKVEYFDVRGNLLKVFTTEKFRQFDGRFWRPMFAKMENVQTGKVTTLEYDNIDFGVGLKDSDFIRSKLGR